MCKCAKTGYSSEVFLCRAFFSGDQFPLGLRFPPYCVSQFVPQNGHHAALVCKKGAVLHDNRRKEDFIFVFSAPIFEVSVMSQLCDGREAVKGVKVSSKDSHVAMWLK